MKAAGLAGDLYTNWNAGKARFGKKTANNQPDLFKA